MSESYFVDTNVFVRYLTGDDEKKAGAVERLLARARSGKVKLMTNELVFAELAWVLKSYYGQTDVFIADLLAAVLNTDGLTVENEDLIREAINLYSVQRIDFVDACIIAYMRDRRISGIYSFDKKHLRRFTDITLMEP